MAVPPAPRLMRSSPGAPRLCLVVALVAQAQALTAAAAAVTSSGAARGHTALTRSEAEKPHEADDSENLEQFSTPEEIQAEAAKEVREAEQQMSAARAGELAPEQARSEAAEQPEVPGANAEPQEEATEPEESEGGEAEAGLSKRVPLKPKREFRTKTGEALKAHLSGKVLSTDDHWRRRRVVRAGQSLAFYCKVHKRFVRMNDKFRMDTSNQIEKPMELNDAWTWERFTVMDARRRRDGEVTFRSEAHKRFVKLWDTHMGVTEPLKDVPANWRSERFVPVEQKDGRVGLFSGVYKRYWRMNNKFMDASIVINNGLPSSYEWEKFLLVGDTDPLEAGDVVGLHSKFHNRFLRLHQTYVDASDPCDANALPTWWTWEQWTVVDGGDGYVALHNKAHSRFLKSGGGMASPPMAADKLQKAMASERFAVVNAGKGEFALFNELHKKYVNINYGKRGGLSAKSSAEGLPLNWALERFTFFKVYDAELQASWIDLRNMNATQSSTFHSYAASRAIDGKIDTDMKKGSCTHTRSEKNPWWQVALPSNHSILKVRVTNRGDCCGSRLDHFSVYVDGKACATNQHILQGQTVLVSCVASGSVVKVQLNKQEYLTICEFGIFGKVADA